MAVLTITPGTLPEEFAVVTWQEVLEAFAQHMTVDFNETFKLFLVSSSTPASTDQDKVWFQVDGDGNPVNINYWNTNLGDWASFINQTSFSRGSLIGFNSAGEQIEIPVGTNGQYLKSNGTDLQWGTFDPSFGDTSGRMVFFSGKYWGEGDGKFGDRRDFPPPKATTIFFNAFNQPTGTYRVLLFIQIYKTTDLDGTDGTDFTFKDGGNIRKVLNYSVTNNDAGGSYSYDHVVEVTLTNGLVPSVVAGTHAHLLGAQMVAFKT